jgi:acetyl-CoA carboxylase carboxyl transferase subunit alpha
MARRALLDFEKPLVELEEQIEQIRQLARDSEVDVSQQLLQLETLATRRRMKSFAALTPAQKIQVARHPQRPSTLDYIQVICDGFIELHGDRRGSDDQALVGGIGRIGDRGVVLIGHQKGRDTKENVARNFGMASPGGYRKAMRLMDHADRFRLPILSFIDTPGAYAGVLAEEQGQGEAIAVNLREMFRLRVPILATVIGEGGSGGALGIGVADRLLMFEHSVYTVASPKPVPQSSGGMPPRRRRRPRPSRSPGPICCNWGWWMRCCPSPPAATTGRPCRLPKPSRLPCWTSWMPWIS